MSSKRIFIVNASFRLPSASNWQELTQLKTSSSSPISRIDSNFWLSRNIKLPDFDDEIFGGILQSPFFADLSQLGIGANEWSFLDPQHRLCLSLVQEMTANLSLPQSTSVFIGASDTGWSSNNTLPFDNRYLLAGSHLSMTSARISYHFDLNGNSKTIDTSCSSSLVAINEAYQAVLAGESEFAICGGVNLFNDPSKFPQLRRMKMLSPDHQCFTFKNNANGYVRSEGGILFLIASETCIDKYNLDPLVEINGGFVNHDGLSAGITAPSLQSQITLHQNSLRASGLNCSDIGYIECHGTGTPLGDPIELKALHAVFNTDSVIVGSIKSKFGHLEAAAGAAGILNCLSLLQDHSLVSVDKSASTSKFSFTDSCLSHSDDCSFLFEGNQFKKSILVGSFGFSGTNASLVISPVKCNVSSPRLSVAIFPGQGRYDNTIGLQEYASLPIYQQSVDTYWSRLQSAISSFSLDLPHSFLDRPSDTTPIVEQYIYLVHLLSLYDFSLYNGNEYDYLIGYSFGEYAASVAGSAFSFEDCVCALYEREKIVECSRGLFHLYYIDNSDLTEALIDQYLPKEVIKCSPSSSIFAISSAFYDQLSSAHGTGVFKYVGVDYCYHSSLLLDKDSLTDRFLGFRLDLADSKFIPSWVDDRSSDNSWSAHFLEPLKFDKLLSRLINSNSNNISFVEISTKPRLKRIVAQNSIDVTNYTTAVISDQYSLDSTVSFSPQFQDSNSSTIAVFILDFISQCTGLDVRSIDRSKTFTRSGLDSLELAQLVSRLSSNFSINFSIDELVGDYHVINHAISEATRRSSADPEPILSLNHPVSAEFSSSHLPSPSHLNSKSESQKSRQPFSREEAVHSILLGKQLNNQLKDSISNRNSYSTLADPRHSAGYSPLYREYQVPVVAESATGAHIRTVDGHKYLDFTMGFGVQIFGHNPSFIKSALSKAIATDSFFIGPQSNLASLNSYLLCELTLHERALFCNTGTEAVMTAVRLSRAYTNRSKILVFNGSYHGHNDFTLASQYEKNGKTAAFSLGTPASYLSDTLIADYSDLNSIKHIVQENHADLAAIVVEPIQSRRPSVDVVSTLQLLRKLCDEYNITLIFDEVLIGFRCHYQSSFGYFGVKSDLSTYGKIIGGGLPIGAVAGKASILNLIDGGAWYQTSDEPLERRVFFAGTFNKNPLTMICCHQVLSEFIRDKGRLQVVLNNSTRRLCSRLNNFFRRKGVPLRVLFASSVFRFTGAPLAFYFELLSRNIYIWEGRTCFLSSAHTSSDLDYFESSIYDAVESLIDCGVLGKSTSSHQNIYLLSHTQLTLCAAYSNCPKDAQSFNQIVSIDNISASSFPSFFAKATSAILGERSLFGVYDLVHAHFSPCEPSSSDWIRFVSEPLVIRDFSPSDRCHVQCIVVISGNIVKEVHFAFAHYAIDGKGINDLFLRILSDKKTADPSFVFERLVDRTFELMPLLSSNHFRFLERGPSVDRFEFILPAQIRLRLIEIAEKKSVTLPTLLLSFYINALQSKLSCQSLVIALFGTIPLSPREAYLHPSFISPIPLVLSSYLKFTKTNLSHLQHTVSQLVLNSSVDASILASHYGIQSSSVLYPLTSFAFNFDKISPVFSGSSYDISFNKFVPSVARWNIFLNIVDNLDSLCLSVDYNPSFITRSCIANIVTHFSTACADDSSLNQAFNPSLPFNSYSSNVAQYVDESFKPINYLSLLSTDFTKHSLRSSSRLIESTNIIEKISRFSLILAPYSDRIFCIRCEEPIDQILSILACWNAGRAYVLWNSLESHDFNLARLSACNVHSIITLHESDFSVDSVSFDSSSDQIVIFDALAHLIFTSGSTGEPKAVPISIHHLASYQASISERLSVSAVEENYRFGILSSLNYDFQFTTILLWLRHGGELFIVDSHTSKSSSFWLTIEDHFFSFLKIIPSLFNTLSEFVPLSKLVPTDILLFGGDFLLNSTAEHCYSVRDKLRIYTHYGPTETCIGCSAYLLPRDLPSSGLSPVGRPLNGYSFVIDDLPEGSYDYESSDSHPSALGLISILTHNTYGMYFDGSDDTYSSIDEAFLYHTGDVGYLNNGILTVVGRVTGFLKINGYRVYIADIRNRISALFPDLVFHLLPIPSSTYRVSKSDHFVMFCVDSPLSLNTVEEMLRESLPIHYCPQRLIPLPSLPLTANGKVDSMPLYLLLEDENSTPNHECVSQSLSSDASLSSFLSSCSAIFPGCKLSLDSNFFLLGGDSLSAIRLSASFFRSGVELASETILVHPEFKDLYPLYLSAQLDTASSCTPTSQYYLTPSQVNILRYFDVSCWYFTFLVNCFESASFADDLAHVLYRSNFTAFSVSSTGHLINCTPTDIPVFDCSYASRSLLDADLPSIADNSVTRLDLKNGINASLTRIHIAEDDSILCLCTFPHYLIDFISFQFLLDSSQSKSSYIHPLGFQNSSFKPPVDFSPYFQQIADTKQLLSADSHFRLNFSSTLFKTEQICFDLPSNIKDSSSQSALLLPHLVSSFCQTISDLFSRVPLFDLEFASRDYPSTSCNTSLGYYSIHLPCVFEHFEISTLSTYLRELQDNCASLFAYQASYPECFTHIPLCSINCLDTALPNTTQSPFLLRHSLSSHESAPLPWSPFMIEAICSSSQVELKLYFDNHQITSSTVEHFLSSLQSSLLSNSILTDQNSLDIMTRLGW